MSLMLIYIYDKMAATDWARSFFYIFIFIILVIIAFIIFHHLFYHLHFFNHFRIIFNHF